LLEHTLFRQVAKRVHRAFVEAHGRERQPELTVAEVDGHGLRTSVDGDRRDVVLVAGEDVPRGLELAFATPRAWLRSGRIVVRRAPTSFGLLSYSIDARGRSIRVRVNVPARTPPSTLRLRLRLPDGQRITGVTLEGRSFHRFDPASETIDLSGLTGRIDLVVAR